MRTRTGTRLVALILAAVIPVTTSRAAPVRGLGEVRLAMPTDGVTLIAAPTASPDGDAVLRYPIRTPAARGDQAPALALTYRSSAGNGWVGVGWSLDVGAIEVDTRWGVPRYDAQLETESYLLAGESLAPMLDRSRSLPRAQRTFHTRREGEFRRIERFGSSPSTYWWRVTDRDGTVHRYGSSTSTCSTELLCDDAGHIARWPLRESCDRHGNCIEYAYEVTSHAAGGAGSVAGQQLYLTTISYPIRAGAPGPYYRVTFNRGLGRTDIEVNARAGVKEVTADRLIGIDVDWVPDGTAVPVRRYQLDYLRSRVGESLLAAIAETGADGVDSYVHRFTYDGGAAQFAGTATWQVGGDAMVVRDELDQVRDQADDSIEDQLRELDLSGPIGTSLSVAGDVHGFVGLSLEAAKEGAIGVKLGGSDSETYGISELIDLNGDQLPDRVYQGLDTGYYLRANQARPGSASTTFAAPVALPTLTAISRDSSWYLSGGPEFYEIVNGLVNWAYTSMTSDAYFADVNGDGLTDLIDDGTIYFNHLEAGVPTFVADDSSATPVPLTTGADVDGTGRADTSGILAAIVKVSPRVDAVRRWIAPYAGVVAITGAVALVPPRAPQGRDGVTVAIEHDGATWWRDTLGAGDTTLHTPPVTPLAVAAGDAVWFRVQSRGDGRDDTVTWDPRIEYTALLDDTGAPVAVSAPRLDASARDQLTYRASGDFTTTGHESVTTITADGLFHLSGELATRRPLSDDVALQVLVNAAVVATVATVPSGPGAPAIDVDTTLVVHRGDRVRVRFDARSPFAVNDLVFAPHAELFTGTAAPTRLAVRVDATHYQPISPGPQTAWIAPAAGVVRAVGEIQVAAGASGLAWVSVKGPRGLIERRALALDGGLVGGVDSVGFDVAVEAGDAIYVDLATDDVTLGGLMIAGAASIDHEPVVPALARVIHRDLFAVPYRSWAAIAYRAEGAAAEDPIATGAFPAAEAALRSGAVDPAELPAYPMAPDAAATTWTGPNTAIAITAGRMTSSRLAIPVARAPGAVIGRSAVSRAASTSQWSIGVGVLSLGASIAGGIGLALELAEEAVGELPGPLSDLRAVVRFVADEVDDGVTEATSDMIDLNGDGFLDVVLDGSVQYTDRQGGLTARRDLGALAPLRRSQSYSANASLGGNPAMAMANAEGRGGPSARGKPGPNGGGSQVAQFGIGGEVGFTNHDQSVDVIDMNGDGLPDRVEHTVDGDLEVALNLGYRFAPAERWGQFAIAQSGAGELGVNASLGVPGDLALLGGGVSVVYSENYAGYRFAFEPRFDDDWIRDLLREVERTLLHPFHAGQMLVDVNGDGRPDAVRPDNLNSSGPSFQVAINTGSGFAPPIAWAAADPTIATTANVTVGAGGFAAIPIPIIPDIPPLPGLWVILEVGGDARATASEQRVSLVDIDGDGRPDHLEGSLSGSLDVAASQIRPSLLVAVDRPLGGRLSLGYQRTGNTYDLPQSHWVLSTVSSAGGVAGDLLQTFGYSGGRYDRFERSFLGFASIEARSFDGTTLVRAVVTDYQNDRVETQGLVEHERVRDGAGRDLIAIDHTYVSLPVASEVAGFAGSAALFPALVATERDDREGGPDHLRSSETWVYDDVGRVTRHGERNPDDAGGQRTEELTYADCTGGDRYVLDEVIAHEVRAADDSVLARTLASVDCAAGVTTERREFASTAAGGTAAITSYLHDLYGNLTEVREPTDAAGNRRVTRFTYDPTLHAFATATTVTFVAADGNLPPSPANTLITTVDYDLRFGLPIATVEPTGATTTITYDGLGRPVRVVEPLDRAAAQPTIAYAYQVGDARTSYAITRRFDASAADPADTIDTVVFVDGLGRIRQRQDDASLFQGVTAAAATQLVVSGPITYDGLGRVIREGQPTAIAPRTGAPALATVTDTAMTTTSYDALDRPLLTTSLGRTTTSAYDLVRDGDGVVRARTTTTDGNGHQRRTERDERDRVVAVTEVAASPTATSPRTSYRYDPLDRLTRVRDAAGNVTGVIYDARSRRTAIVDPSTGTTAYGYDDAGRITSVRRNRDFVAGVGVRYRYDGLGRLTEIRQPTFTASDVVYTWGAAGTGARSGRMIAVSDRGGRRSFDYDLLGQVTRTDYTVIDPRATVADPVRPPAVIGSYAVLEEHDGFGRTLRMVYPDGEQVRYRYDAGGRPRGLTGSKLGTGYGYLRRMEYDRFGATVFVEAGNGVTTEVGFDPVTRMVASSALRKPRTGATPGIAIAELTYSHDAVGNLTASTNAVGFSLDAGIGGAAAHSFRYDEYDQLVGATGRDALDANHDRTYDFTARYDALHDLAGKTQADIVTRIRNGRSTIDSSTTHELVYRYAGGARTPVRIDDDASTDDRAYQYDADGNLAGWTVDRSNQARAMVWDDEDRLYAIRDNGRDTMIASYDDAGHRVVQEGQGGRTIYVGELFTDGGQNAQVKHFFVADLRLVSKTVKNPILAPAFVDDLAVTPADTNPLYPRESDLVYYHRDGVGSTHYTTDALAVTSGHFEYLPFGETWLEERGTNAVPFRFDGKERDASGLYDYGQRYYDPRTALWQSADPALPAYLDGDGARGGAGDPRNLASYGYVWQNPQSRVDPSGLVISDGEPGVALFWAGAKPAVKQLRGLPGVYALQDTAIYRNVSKPISRWLKPLRAWERRVRGLAAGQHGVIDRAVYYGVWAPASAVFAFQAGARGDEVVEVWGGATDRNQDGWILRNVERRAYQLGRTARRALARVRGK